MIIKKIFSNNLDDEVHTDFLKYSKGQFNKKYLLECKNNNGFFHIKSGPEFANYFVRKGLEMAKENILIKGIIISTLDLDVSFSSDKKQFMGIKQYKIDAQLNPKEILEFVNKNKKLFFALSFSLPGYELKIKPKMPKSPKPSNKIEDEDNVGPSFCSLKTNSKEVFSDLFFDVKQNFKELFIEHSIFIEEIIYPEGFQKMKPEEIREKSKRKGRVIRRVFLDGKEIVSEASFIV